MSAVLVTLFVCCFLSGVVMDFWALRQAFAGDVSRRWDKRSAVLKLLGIAFVLTKFITR